ncbi:MAG: SNF2-related protein [Pseudomonadota bacterium]|nr:SNF2-related protein [Pseudomonadota bacterium]
MFTAQTEGAKRWFGFAKSPDVVLSTEEWTREDHALATAIAELRRIGEEGIGLVRFEDDRIVADHAAAAALGSAAARQLGLPETAPYAFHADTRGTIGKENFRLVGDWMDGGRPVSAKRAGAFLTTAEGIFRIPEPIYSALELCDSFEAGAVDLPEHWAALAKFRASLDPATAGDLGIKPDAGDLVRMAAALQETKIFTAAACSLSLRNDDGAFRFDPVLFDKATVEARRESGLEISETDGLLGQAQGDAFRNDPGRGFAAFDRVKRTYVVGRGQYVLLDDDLATVLQVVRDKQQAPLEERKAFFANPKPAMRQALEAKRDQDIDSPDAAMASEEAVDTVLEALFQETLEYADRAIGTGVWQKPELEFLPKVSNVWLPETFAVNLDGTWVNVSESTAPAARKELQAAIAEGRPSVEIDGKPVPATPQALVDFDRQVRIRGAPPAPEPAPKPEELAGPEKIVVTVHANFVEEDWEPKTQPREAPLGMPLPDSIRTRAMAHQVEGIDWQIATWRAGMPGILNADDQGLGKTFQTLAFLAWLRSVQRAGPPEKRLPILVVAPTSLLRNWEREVEHHLAPETLGTLVTAYGSTLRQLKADGMSGTDLGDGRARLDFAATQADIRLGNGDRWWVLTSYETLANYQHSFHAVPFSVVIFDEIQKIKNVQTINANAARAVKADFRIGLTGTPIENHILDLWAIVDALAPLRLGSMKDFAASYKTITEEAMTELHARLFKPVHATGGREYPPLGLRRVKEDCLGDLPRKDYRLYPGLMPDIQAKVYEEAREKLRDGARGNALTLLHHIRGVSLHPRAPRAAAADPDGYVSESARLRAVLELLDSIRDAGERALIFIEDHEMQYFVAELLRARYGLREVLIINGQTPVRKRQRHVETFQRHLQRDEGFDVMVLGPKSAGVGLTLTAATHVIHLSRWWNPAVEEQCNDRIYRIGQTRDVTVHMPLAVHPARQHQSFDCVLNALMKKKRSLARAIIWPPTQDDNDLSALLSGIDGTSPVDFPNIDDRDWQMFEYWVQDRARDSGEWQASLTRRSNEGGADVVLEHRVRKDSWALAQAKHTTSPDRPVGIAAVQQVIRGRTEWGKPNPQLVVITNAASFTQDAMDMARREDVRLVGRHQLSLWPHHILA